MCECSPPHSETMIYKEMDTMRTWAQKKRNIFYSFDICTEPYTTKTVENDGTLWICR